MKTSSICIRYDSQSYNKNQFDEIYLPGINIKIEKLKQKTVDTNAVILITSTAVTLFGVGFFSKAGEKAGEKVGEAIGQDIVNAYKKFKEKLLNALFSAKSRGSQRLGLIITSEEIGSPEVQIYVQPNSNAAAEALLDSAQDIYNGVVIYIKKHSLKEITRFVVALEQDGQHIRSFYFISKNEDVFFSE